MDRKLRSVFLCHSSSSKPHPPAPFLFRHHLGPAEPERRKAGSPRNERNERNKSAVGIAVEAISL